MYGYIYKTTNLANGKIYIGKHKSKVFDPNYPGSGDLLWKAIHKYGREYFFTEFLIPCFSLEELNAEEAFLIEWFNAKDHSIGYNRADGGDGGDLRKYMTPEQYQDWRKANGDSQRGRKLSEEHRANISRGLKGRVISEEHRSKISSSEKGKLVSDSTKEKLRLSHLGKTWTEESKAKAKATRMAPEHRRRMSEICKNRVYHKICIVCGRDFTSRGSKAKYCSELCKKGG